MMSLRNGMLMFLLLLSARRAESVQLDHTTLLPSSSLWETTMSNEKYIIYPLLSRQEFIYGPHRLNTTRKSNTVQSEHDMVLSRQDQGKNGSIIVTVLNSTINQGAKVFVTVSNTGGLGLYWYNYRIVHANVTDGRYDPKDVRPEETTYNECRLSASGTFQATVPVGKYKIALRTSDNAFIGFSNSFEVKPISLSVTVPKTDLYLGETVELQFDSARAVNDPINNFRCRVKSVSNGELFDCSFIYVSRKYKWLPIKIKAGTYQLEFYLSYSTDIDTKESYKAVSNGFTIRENVVNLSIEFSTSSIVQGQAINALIQNKAGVPIGYAEYSIIYANYTNLENVWPVYSGYIEGSSNVAKLILKQNLVPGRFKLLVITYDKNQTMVVISTNFTVNPFTAIGRNISIAATKTVPQGNLVIFVFNIDDLTFFPDNYAYGIYSSKDSIYINGTRYDKYLRRMPSTFVNTNKGVVSIEANWGRGTYKLVLLLKILDYYNNEIKWTKVGESNEFVVTNNQPTIQPARAPSKRPTGSMAPTQAIGPNTENASMTITKASVYQGQAFAVVITSISRAPLGHSSVYVVPANYPVNYTSILGGNLQGGASTETTRIVAYATSGSYKLALFELDSCGNRSNVYGLSNLFEIKAHPKNVTTIVASGPVRQNDIFLLNISNSEFQMDANLFFFSLYHANTTNLQNTQLEFHYLMEIDNARKGVVSLLASWPLGMYKIVFFLVTEGAREYGDPFCIPIAETRFTVQNTSATIAPSTKPISQPTVKPSTKPSTKLSNKPTTMPTVTPTIKPSKKPSTKPTIIATPTPCLSRYKRCKVGAKPCCSKLKCRRFFFRSLCW